MPNRRVTVELPESVFLELARIAELTNQSLEAVAAQRITTNLPPSVENAPPEIQAELLLLQTLAIDELLKIAQSKVTFNQQARHEELLEKNQIGAINSSERQELRELSLAADKLMLKKAYAWAILR
ncbi:hypothetical protein ACE1CI_00195 [Aerosakkonemataceae cyanobacterium BLCC-F50]|uniref:CopG-like ribbon-helix-helix domain-containing protein n=1 Tax=Floridaenema flaviceps BLCC-F50 TaxID=3153642 RepID=A0ABV4XI07_9CYAN